MGLHGSYPGAAHTRAALLGAYHKCHSRQKTVEMHYQKEGTYNGDEPSENYFRSSDLSCTFCREAFPASCCLSVLLLNTIIDWMFGLAFNLGDYFAAEGQLFHLDVTMYTAQVRTYFLCKLLQHPHNLVQI
jgi:hypothetical protein